MFVCFLFVFFFSLEETLVGIGNVYIRDDMEEESGKVEDARK